MSSRRFRKRRTLAIGLPRSCPNSEIVPRTIAVVGVGWTTVRRDAPVNVYRAFIPIREITVSPARRQRNESGRRIDQPRTARVKWESCDSAENGWQN
jgi:hypothetical protein